MKRFADHAGGAFFPGRDRCIKGRVGRHHEHDGLTIEPYKLLESGQPSHSGHRNIHQNQVKGTVFVRFDRLFAGLGEIDLVAGTREDRLKHIAHYFFVVTNEYRTFLAHKLSI